MPATITVERVNLLPSAARTANGSATVAADVFATSHMDVTLTITAASGTTPVLSVILEKSGDGGTTWATVDTFPNQSTTATVTRPVYGGGWSLMRVRWVITGTTPSFTFVVDATADQRRYRISRRRR